MRAFSARAGPDTPFDMLDTFFKLLIAAAVLSGAATALAQDNASGKTATLGTAKAGSQLLTLEELRSCLKQRTALGQRKQQIETERATLDGERQALAQTDESLAAERAQVDQLNQSVADFGKHAKVLSQQVADFNERAARFNAAPPSGPTGDRQRRALEQDQAAMEKATRELEAERATLGDAEKTVQRYRERAGARDQAAADWNARSTRASEAASIYTADLQVWTEACAGRPYREDDEKLIQSGQ